MLDEESFKIKHSLFYTVQQNIYERSVMTKKFQQIEHFLDINFPSIKGCDMMHEFCPTDTWRLTTNKKSVA